MFSQPCPSPPLPPVFLVSVPTLIVVCACPVWFLSASQCQRSFCSAPPVMSCLPKVVVCSAPALSATLSCMLCLPCHGVATAPLACQVFAVAISVLSACLLCSPPPLSMTCYMALLCLSCPGPMVHSVDPWQQFSHAFSKARHWR